jgi:hypothetical protein
MKLIRHLHVTRTSGNLLASLALTPVFQRRQGVRRY